LVEAFGFRIQDFGFWVQASGFRVEALIGGKDKDQVSPALHLLSEFGTHTTVKAIIWP